MLEALSNILVVMGIFLLISSLIGYFRMSNVLTRIHAAGIFDSCAIMLFIFSFIFRSGFTLLSLKLLLLLLFVLISSPTACHALCKFSISNKDI